MKFIKKYDNYLNEESNLIYEIEEIIHVKNQYMIVFKTQEHLNNFLLLRRIFDNKEFINVKIGDASITFKNVKSAIYKIGKSLNINYNNGDNYINIELDPLVITNLSKIYARNYASPLINKQYSNPQYN